MFFVAAVAGAYLITGDGIRWMHGAWAEDWTREALRVAVKHKIAWRALDFVPLQGGDIDHVLIAPAGVVAVETKYFGKTTRAGYIDDHVRQAARSATRVDGLIRSVKQHPHRVLPLLVVWGPGAAAVDEISQVNGVTVARGSALGHVLKTLSTGSLAEDHAEALAAALTAFRENLTV
jgi:hypothetical protein